MPSRRRIIDDRLYAHFVTFSVRCRRRLLDHDHPKRIVFGVLNEELRQREALCIGFVLMPDHVHGIIWLAQTGALSALMHGWKQNSSFHIRYMHENPVRAGLVKRPTDWRWSLRTLV